MVRTISSRNARATIFFRSIVFGLLGSTNSIRQFSETLFMGKDEPQTERVWILVWAKTVLGTHLIKIHEPLGESSDRK